MSEHISADPSEITFHHEPASSTKRIWKIFWVLSFLTIIELALGYYLYATHGTHPAGFVLGTKAVIAILTLAKAYYIVSVFMHLGDEIRNFIMTIIVPLSLFIWFIAAFLWDGNSWKNMRNTDAGSRPDTHLVQPAAAAHEGEKH